MKSPAFEVSPSQSRGHIGMEGIIADISASACFQTESAWLARGGFPVLKKPRLYKVLENEMVRVIYPTANKTVDEGTAIGLICLYSIQDRTTVYAHACFAGPTANASLRSIFNPPTQAKPQPGLEGNLAILKFIAWKTAGWSKFLNDELAMGTDEASRIWLDNFWKALDRMYGGGNLIS